MAIIPLQIKMVYGIGQAHGVALDQGHIKEFIAAAGVGLTSQYLEQFGRKLLGGLLGKAAGKTFGKIGGAATGMAFSFATTYALGQAAKRYYAGGRTMNTALLRETFQSLLGPAKQMQAAVPATNSTEGRHARRRPDHGADARQHGKSCMTTTSTIDSFATGPMWAGFIAFVLAMLALDLFVFGGRKAHRVHVKEALAWVIAWTCLALAFAGLLWWYLNGTQGRRGGAEEDARIPRRLPDRTVAVGG